MFLPLIEARDETRPSANVVVVCEHASNHFPEVFGTLGLGEDARRAHIAWDPGALGVARAMAAELNADLVAGSVSRLIYDCNRPPEAPSAFPERSELYEIPGNRALSEADRAERAAAVYTPFRKALAALMQARGQGVLVTVHSFTPVYQGVPRDCEIGILHDRDSRLADALLSDWPGAAPWRATRNAPYGPEDGVTHTLVEHGIARDWPNVMLEIRNDLIASEAAQLQAGRFLARRIALALPAMNGGGNDA
ncbi:N-formylglutamate amidohydrolase [Salipiger abyssi]|uniref:Putative N-formylglutamate amidohydrolase n=1 Tax=Salipiger abyssi TaxID=1250539 RepID=A0A1P8UMW3_9RHOB|nr:N-formylglutamate amidohydrolase [Salipiger abyssi]APZ50751.1 putative N-formylglutamate amidohydrolase [Salipiger abyssi]